MRLKDHWDQSLARSILDAVGRSFREVEAGCVKMILRFACNDSDPSSAYKNAYDVPPPVILGHRAPMGPLLACRDDTVARLRRPGSSASKARVRDALHHPALLHGMTTRWR